MLEFPPGPSSWRLPPRRSVGESHQPWTRRGNNSSRSLELMGSGTRPPPLRSSTDWSVLLMAPGFNWTQISRQPQPRPAKSLDSIDSPGQPTQTQQTQTQQTQTQQIQNLARSMSYLASNDPRTDCARDRIPSANTAPQSQWLCPTLERAASGIRSWRRLSTTMSAGQPDNLPSNCLSHHSFSW